MRFLTSSALLIFLVACAGGLFAAQSTQVSSNGQLAFPTHIPNADAQRRSFDKGIYAPTYADGKSMCAAIMSYNFTPGDNPELKSITTCTPARPNSVYRTDDENRKRPPAPSLLMISTPPGAPRTKGSSAR